MLARLRQNHSLIHHFSRSTISCNILLLLLLCCAQSSCNDVFLLLLSRSVIVIQFDYLGCAYVGTSIILRNEERSVDLLLESAVRRDDQRAHHHALLLQLLLLLGVLSRVSCHFGR